MSPVILFVDTNRQLLNVVPEFLKETYSVIATNSVKDFFFYLEKEPVQLIICGGKKQGFDSSQLCQEIKMNRSFNHIPFIVLTSSLSMKARLGLLRMGADAIVSTPISRQYLLAQVSNILANRNRFKEFLAQSPLLFINEGTARGKSDEQFLDRITQVICQNIQASHFTAGQLARKMNMSRPTFYRKVKQLSQITPNELIHFKRLEKSAELLLQGNYKIIEVAKMVGYSSQNNFGRKFLKVFGVSPTRYQKANFSKEQLHVN